MCRAIAATMFNDASKFKVTPLNTQQRFTALQSGEIDVLTRNTTETLTRDTTLGLVGTGVNYYDSQGVMVPKELGVKSARELSGATICVQPGTTTELNLADWFRANRIEFKPVVIEKYDEIVRAFAGPLRRLHHRQIAAGIHAHDAGEADGYVILPEDFSKEPLGPMVRQDDVQWFNVVRWALNAMLEAEEYGIKSDNVDAHAEKHQSQRAAHPGCHPGHGQEPGRGRQMGIHHRRGRSAITVKASSAIWARTAR